MRIDHQLVEQWIEPNSRVLDLGAVMERCLNIFKSI